MSVQSNWNWVSKGTWRHVQFAIAGNHVLPCRSSSRLSANTDVISITELVPRDEEYDSDATNNWIGHILCQESLLGGFMGRSVFPRRRERLRTVEGHWTSVNAAGGRDGQLTIACWGRFTRTNVFSFLPKRVSPSVDSATRYNSQWPRLIDYIFPICTKLEKEQNYSKRPDQSERVLVSQKTTRQKVSIVDQNSYLFNLFSFQTALLYFVSYFIV